MTTNVPTVPRNPLPVMRAPMPTMSVQDTIKAINARPFDRSKMWIPPVKASAVSPRTASNTVEGPDSIVELARALNNNPDLIFEWVYNNIEFHPTFGEAKGALGCLIDGVGNNFDQCELLYALFTQAGLSPSYVFGNLQLSLAQANGWLGTDPADGGGLAFGVLNDGGVPVQFAQDGQGNTQLFFPYLWIKVAISGTNYVFDPSFKQYTSTSTINLATALGFTESTFISSAESGATITAASVQNLNRANLRAGMATYATNLQNYIKTNNPNAATGDIYGGRSIIPLTAPVRLTALPYEAPGDVPTIWTTIPDNYRTTYEITCDTPVTFYGSDVHAQQLTYFQISGQPGAILTLNGTVVQTYPVASTCTVTVTHPYLSNFANETFYSDILPTNLDQQVYYMFGCCFGPMTQSTVDYWQNRLMLAQATGGAATSEPIMGASLSLLYYARAAQSYIGASLAATINACTIAEHHDLGVSYWLAENAFPAGNGAAGFNLGAAIQFVVPLYFSSSYQAASVAVSYLNNTLEMLTIQQFTGADAVATPRIIDVANSQGTVIYQITPADQSTYLPLLTGYPPVFQSDYEGSLSSGQTILIPQSYPQVSGDLNGGGWLTQYNGEVGGVIAGITITNGGLNTKSAQSPKAKPRPKMPKEKKKLDPVVVRTGDYTYESSDITVGSSDFPYALEFKSMYDSRLFTQNSMLGLGWSHNWNITAFAGSDYLRSLGSQSPIEAAVSVATMYVLTALSADTTYPADKTALMELIADWWNDQLTGNAVTVSLADGDYTFVKLIGGTYNPQLGDPSSLVLSGGTYTHTTPQQVKRNFNTSGYLSTLVFPYGVTITLGYTSGNLTSISNGLNRTLTLGYSGGYLSTVTDGNSRTVNYTVNATTKQLTSISDPLMQVTTFTYDSSNRFVSYFLPQNPTKAFVTNSYDTLNRVSSQENIYGNVWTCYIAGSRSEFVDPNLGAAVDTFDQFGYNTSSTDELGNTTSYQYDGRRRMISRTLSEGNSTAWTYDGNNNQLTATYTPKPGSSLATIIETWTYDATYNKKHTFVDGNGKTWTWNYDPATGNLLSAVKPVINSQTPQEVWTYNTRGQALTYTDETSIVRKFTYDTATEKLLTVVDDYGVSPHLNLTQQFGYDAVGNRNSVTDPNLNITTYLFDNNRQLKQKTDPTPFSYVTTYGYDLNGNQTTVQRQTGIPATPYQTYTTAYTMSNQIYTVTDPASHVTTNTYDVLDRLWTTTDAQSRVTTFVYDARSKLYTVKDATNTISETRTYTNNGHLYQLKDARSETTTYSYDGYDRPDKTTYADASYEENQSYDKNGNLLTYRTRSGNTIVNTFDVLNRLATKAPTGEAVVTLVYDLHGRLLSTTTPVVSGNPATGAFSIAYDTAGRVKSETTPDSKVTQYGLDSSGNLTKLTYPDGYYVTRVFDQLNRLTNIKLNGATASAIGITYDQLSRRNVLTYGNGATSTYTFALNEDMTGLAAAFVGSSVTFGYGFNNVHQETSRSVSDGSYMWHPLAAATTTYAAANTVNEYPTVGGKTYTYDANANLKTDGTWTYTFDTENHLLSASKTGTSASYVYDPLHRQIQKTVGTAKSRYVYSGWQRIADYDGTAGTLQNRYVYGTGLDEPLVQVSSSGTLTYLHADRQGSIISTTNSSGAIINELKYGPFGESSALVGTTFGLNGQRYDAETGLYYCKYRHYSPALGRFLEGDPLKYKDSLNLYTFVLNDPLNNKDVLGLNTIVIIGGAELALFTLLLLAAALYNYEQNKKKFPNLPLPFPLGASPCQQKADDRGKIRYIDGIPYQDTADHNPEKLEGKRGITPGDVKGILTGELVVDPNPKGGNGWKITDPGTGITIIVSADGVVRTYWK